MPNFLDTLKNRYTAESGIEKVGHTGLGKPPYYEAFWEASKDLPRQQLVNLAAMALVSQVHQNGFSSETRDFIRSIKSRFSPEEIWELKTQIKSRLSLGHQIGMEIGNIFKLLDQPSVEPTVPKGLFPGDGIRFQTPDEIFFQTSMRWEPPPRRVRGVSY